MAQVGLELLTSSDLPTSTSQSVGMTGVSNHSAIFKLCFAAVLRWIRDTLLSYSYL